MHLYESMKEGKMELVRSNGRLEELEENHEKGSQPPSGYQIPDCDT